MLTIFFFFAHMQVRLYEIYLYILKRCLVQYALTSLSTSNHTENAYFGQYKYRRVTALQYWSSALISSLMSPLNLPRLVLPVTSSWDRLEFICMQMLYCTYKHKTCILGNICQLQIHLILNSLKYAKQDAHMQISSINILHTKISHKSLQRSTVILWFTLLRKLAF